ncbi:hypothetical protein BsIDN1_68720 [Bacillus safensis]|uniref:Uncharacterized protein n=1 Tax=Bacillus safensis TaxID=561879 RepID=A0A5S9MLW6_BACIA|nr:hypothetical protein BsIDN1_68720 [Bacillus safensis]
MNDHPEPVISLQAEEFEMLLEQASEAKKKWPSFLNKAENQELVKTFVSDVQTRKKKDGLPHEGHL